MSRRQFIRLVIALCFATFAMSAQAANENTASGAGADKPCILQPEAGHGFIVRDASRRIPIVPTKKSIEAYVRGVAEVSASCVDVPSGQYRVEETGNADHFFLADYDKKAAVLEATHVPLELTNRVGLWNLVKLDATKTVVAAIPLETVSPITAGPISVRYSDPVLNGMQGDPVRGDGDPKKGVAVTNPLWDLAAPVYPQDLDSWKKAGWPNLPPEFPSWKKQGVRNRVSLELPSIDGLGDDYFWGLDEETADDTINYFCAENPHASKDRTDKRWNYEGSPACYLPDRGVTFAARVEGGPVVVRIGLYKKNLAAKGDTRYLRATVRLADKVEGQSLPIKIGQQLFIRCEDDVFVMNGGVAAIDDSSLLVTKSCRLFFSPLGASEKPSLEKDGKTKYHTGLDPDLYPEGKPLQGWQTHELEQLVQSGRQKLDVTVRRDKSGDPKITHPLIDWREIKSFAVAPAAIDLGQLQLPDKAGEGDGPVTISVTLAAIDPDAHYRLPAANASTEPGTRADERFDSSLRPRGPFGLKGPWRIFLTIPTQFASLRIPANPRNLQTSSQSANYEFVTFRLGLQAGFEPWDYRRGKSLYPIPFRFLVGFNFASIGSDAAKLDPSFVISFALTLPVFQEEGKAASQVGTSLAIGPSFEVDLRDGHPYFLFNLGVDLFTLLAAK